MTEQEILEEHIKECVSIKKDSKDFKFVVIHKLNWFNAVGCNHPSEVGYIINSWKENILKVRKEMLGIGRN